MHQINGPKREKERKKKVKITHLTGSFQPMPISYPKTFNDLSHATEKQRQYPLSWEYLPFILDEAVKFITIVCIEFRFLI